MQITDYQKYLKVMSILDTIGGGLALVFGLLALVGGIAVGTANPEALASADTEAASLAAAAVVSSFAGVVVILAAAFTLAQGILGLRASKDATKVKPVWWLSLISLAFGVIGIVSSITSGTFNMSSLISVILCGVTFWAANGIKSITFPKMAA